MRVVLALFLILGVSTYAVCQSPEASWDNLRQLTAGQKVQVVDMKLKSIEGEFLALSDQTISLMRGQDAVTFQRTDVFRVGAHGGGRLRNSLKGGVIGLAVGLIVGAAADFLDDVDGTDPGSNNGKLGGAAVGLMIGAGVGAAFPGYHTIYRATSK